MRVRINYTVDIEDVSSEVEQLFDFVYEKKLKLDSQLELVEKFLEEKQFQPTIDAISKMRKTLEEMDARAADCSSIIQGLVEYHKAISEGVEDDEVHQGGPAMDTTGSHDVPRPIQPTGV